MGDTESQHQRRCVWDAHEAPHTYVLKPMLGRHGEVLMFLYFRYAIFTNTERLPITHPIPTPHSRIQMRSSTHHRMHGPVELGRAVLVEQPGVAR